MDAASSAIEDVLKKYRNARVIVVGATGFIGRWVARALGEATLPVLVVRNANLAREVFPKYSINGEIRVLDAADLKAVRRLVADVRPAVVFNLAGYGVDPTERDPRVARRINAELVQVLCSACAAHSDRTWSGLQLVHVGSALEYGTASGPLSEDTAEQPTTLYGRTKLEGTNALRAGCRQFGIAGTTARLFTVYGFGEPNGRLLPSLLRAATTADHFDLTSGTQRRDFTYVGDVAEGLLRLGTVVAGGEPVNLATGQLTSVRQFVMTAARVLGMPPARLRFGVLPARPEEMYHDPVSIDRLRQLTGWAPTTTIDAGIAQTVQHEATTRSRRSG